MKYQMKSLHYIYSIWFLTWIEFIKQDIAIIFHQFIKTRLFQGVNLSIYYIWAKQTWLEN